MNILRLTLDGKPIPKERSRKGVSKYGKEIWYNPQSDLENRIKNKIRKQLPEEFLIIPAKKPIKIHIMFFFNPVKSEKKVKEYDPFCKKGDIDNIIKFYTDSMNKIIYYDDCQIYSVMSEKRYTYGDQRTEIEVIWDE